jgi:hypothetical protein
VWLVGLGDALVGYLLRFDQPLVCGFFLCAILIIRSLSRPPRS